MGLWANLPSPRSRSRWAPTSSSRAKFRGSSGVGGRVPRLFLRHRDADVSDDSERIRARAPYSPITSRLRLRLPDDSRVAVWTIVNVESWSPAFAMPRTVLPPPMSGALLPDIPNWAWHEYGMRVGFWRFVEALGSRGLRASFAVNGGAIQHYDAACRAARDAGWDFIGHGFVQRPMHLIEDQRNAIRRTIDAIAEFTGRPPRGWESPGLTETADTLEWLARPGSNMSATGAWTISRYAWRWKRGRSYPCPIASKSTMS